jgi:ribonucleoside-diphosphate reductase alpha chain
MDDIIDLEQRRLTAIIAKIVADPEDDELKEGSVTWWENIRHKTGEGRRYRNRITAEGDMLAALGLRYGTDEATDFSVRVHRTLAVEAYRASQPWRQKGSIPIYNAVREKDNPFISRLRETDPEMVAEMEKQAA